MEQTTAFNVASQSIDRLWAVARRTTTDDAGDRAYNAANAGRIATAPAHNIVVNNPAFFNYDAQINVFAECTSSLRIMANKVLEIVQ